MAYFRLEISPSYKGLGETEFSETQNNYPYKLVKKKVFWNGCHEMLA